MFVFSLFPQIFFFSHSSLKYTYLPALEGLHGNLDSSKKKEEKAQFYVSPAFLASWWTKGASPGRSGPVQSSPVQSREEQTAGHGWGTTAQITVCHHVLGRWQLLHHDCWSSVSTVLYSPCSSTLQGSTAQLSSVQQCEGPLAVQWRSPQERQSTWRSGLQAQRGRNGPERPGWGAQNTEDERIMAKHLIGKKIEEEL